jgi:hypothetical protein
LLLLLLLCCSSLCCCCSCSCCCRPRCSSGKSRQRITAYTEGAIKEAVAIQQADRRNWPSCARCMPVNAASEAASFMSSLCCPDHTHNASQG